jgi:Fe-S oxidoreductase
MASLKREQTMLLGWKKADRMSWAEGLGLKDVLKETAEVLFFPGCKYSYESGLREQVRGMVALMRKAGADFGILGNADACCGGRAVQMGFVEAFEDRAASNLKALEKAGIKTIVTPCSDCYHTFKRQYPKLGSHVEVLHFVEYLDRLLSAGALRFSRRIPLKVTYHDPCHLGRLGEPFEAWEGQEKKILNQVHTWDPKRPRYNGAHGIYDAPRRVLDAIEGVERVEMERIREYSWCCGAGGGCGETSPEFSAWTAGERITEARSTGAEALVTACPWCRSRFEGAVDEQGRAMPVVDLIELALRAL